MEFIQVLRRLCSICGYLAVLLSVNGLQMVGAQWKSCKIVKGLDSDKLHDCCTERSINWLFTAPAAPHQNRCAEALDKSCRHALKKVIGEQLLSLFELHTCLQETVFEISACPVA